MYRPSRIKEYRNKFKNRYKINPYPQSKNQVRFHQIQCALCGQEQFSLLLVIYTYTSTTETSKTMKGALDSN